MKQKITLIKRTKSTNVWNTSSAFRDFVIHQPRLIAWICCMMLALSTMAQYSGTLNVNPSGGGDFTSIKEAIDSLKSKGVNGATTLLIKTGTYHEEIELKDIGGLSATNTLMIQSAANNTDSVLINLAGSNSLSAQLKINNISYVTLRRFSISSANCTDLTVVEMGNNVRNCNFVGLKMVGETGTATAANSCLWGTSLTGTNNVIIDSCTFLNGSYGINMASSSVAGSQNLLISNCHFQNYYLDGINLTYRKHLSILKCTFNSGVSSSTNGIYLTGMDSTIIIDGNDILLTQGNYGLTLSSCNAYTNDGSRVINNRISILDNSTSIGIFGSSSGKYLIAGNSVYLNSNSTSTANACYYFSSCNNLEFKNNIGHNVGGGFALTAYTNGQFSSSDYNNFRVHSAQMIFTPSGIFTTIGKWSASSGFDTHSLSVNPRFTSVDNLTSNNGYLNQAGVNLALLTNDFFGNVRSNPPSIGATEVSDTAPTPLSGNYTINPGGAGGTNFKTFGAAVNALDSLGISGSVIFSVSSGTYNEQVVILDIPGNSISDSIVFKSVTGNAADVVLTFSANATDNFTLSLKRTFGITFRNITIKSTNTTYGRVVYLGHLTQNLNMSGCILEGTTAAGSNGTNVFVESNNNYNNIIQHSKIIKGNNGIYQNSAINTDPCISLVNDTIIDFKEYGIYAYNFDSALIQDCYFASTVSYNSAIGIYLNTVKFSDIQRNHINLQNCGGGIYLYSCVGVANSYSRTFNNSITVKQSNSCFGINLSYSQYINIYHNSINNLSPVFNLGSSNVTLYVTSDVKLVNNSLRSEGNAAALYSSVSGNISYMKYNNLSTKGVVLAQIASTPYSDLAAFKNGTAFGDSSISVNPRYVASDNLHTNYSYLDNAGKYLSEVTEDFDGQSRSNPPCIGFDEFVGTAITPMSGIYTIDTAGSGSRNFTTFNLAVNALDSCGISDSVEFKVASATYYEQISFDVITGSSASKKVRFTSATNNRNDVILQFAATGINDNYVVKLNKSRNLSFNNITFKATGSSYSTVFNFRNDIQNVQIDSSKIEGVLGNGLNKRLLQADLNGDSLITISYTTFKNSSISLYLSGNTNTNNNIQLIKDTIDQFNEYGISSNNVKNLTVQGCVINSTVYGSSIGLFSSGNYNKFDVLENKIFLNPGSFGLYIYYAQGSPSNHALIRNNSISVHYSSGTYGIYATGSSYLDIFNNSVYATGGSINAHSCLSLVSASTNVQVVNNILYGTRAFHTSDLGSITYMKFNCMAGISSTLASVSGTTYNDLSAWHAASSFGDSSISVNPYYTSISDLTTTYAYLDNAGKSLSEVTKDIDGENRSNPPCLGFDEFTATAITKMSGVYTIDSSGVGARNFISFSKAIKSLDSMGISGPVEFRVATGTYNDQITLGPILGASSTNVIRFTAATYDKSDVLLQFYANNSNDNFVVNLNKTKYVNFDNIRFKALDETYSRVFLLTNDVQYFSIDSCSVEGASNTGINRQLFRANVVGDTMISITYTRFIGGSVGIYLNGNSATENRIVIAYDTFTNFREHAIYNNAAKNMTINGCVLTSNASTSTQGIFGTGSFSNCTITNNKIILSSGEYGIYLSNYAGSNSKRGLIANNEIAILDNSTSIGIVLYAVSYLDVFYNSILVTSTQQNTSSSAIYIYSGCSNIGVKNNIFSNIGGGYAALYTDLANLTSCDYNNYYSESKLFIYRTINYSNIDIWRSISNLDSHSLSVKPRFFANDDLRTTYYYLDNAGTQIPQITTDRFGNARSNPPCLGSYEFVGSPISPMAGVYTINPAGSGATNFTTFGLAVNAMDSLGINGDVVFEVSSGTYSEQIKLNKISGLSAANTITFRSVTQNKSDVILSYSATSSADNYVVKLNNVSFVKFEDISIKALGASFQRAIEMEGVVSDLTFDRMLIEGSGQNSSGSVNHYLIYGVNLSNDTNLIFKNSVIKNSGSLFYSNNNGVKGSNLFFDHDTLTNFGYYGIYANNESEVTIMHCEMQSTGVSSSGTVILINNGGPGHQIHHNTIVVTAANRGITIQSCASTSALKTRVYNNMVSLSSVNGAYNMNIYYSPFTQLFNNSLYQNSSSTASVVLYTAGANTDSIWVMNNIIQQIGNGKALFYNTLNYVVQHHHNCVYSSSSNIAQVNATSYNYANMVALGIEAVGLNVDPGFVSSTDLHATTADLYNAGDASVKSLITDDIDGDLRSASSLCIGADEFTPAFSNDIALYELVSPVTECGLTKVPIIVKLKNFGNSSEDSIPVRYKLNGGAEVVDTFFTSIGPNETKVFTFLDSLDLTGISTFTFKIYTGLTTDVNNTNDTFSNTFYNHAAWSTSITGDTAICYGEKILLQATGANYYTWNNNRKTSANLVYVYSTSDYSVIMENIHGCKRYDTVHVSMLQKPSLSFVGTGSYLYDFVSPLVGSSLTNFTFRVKYSHPLNIAPANAQPLLQIDNNNNGYFDDFVDLSFGLNQENPSDATYTDGKLYTVTTTLNESEFLKTRFTATDTNGCTNVSNYKNQPIVDNDLVDIKIDASDINFSNINPDPDEKIWITAKIRNGSNYASGSFLVALYEEDSVIITTRVGNINAKSDTTIKWYHQFDHEEFFPMKVVIDTLDEVQEDNENNNFAIRPVIVGDFVLNSGINVSASFSSDNICASRTFSFNGVANYTDVNTANTLVQGATVEFTVDQTGAKYQSYTNKFGAFSMPIWSPSVPGTYTIKGSITDFTLIRTFVDTFTVVNCYNPYDIRALISYDSSVLVVGDSCQGTVRFSNIGDANMFNVKCKAYNNEGRTIIDTTIILLKVDSTLTFPFKQIFNTIGVHTGAAKADYSNVYEENQEGNNFSTAAVRVLPPKPDIVPVINSAYTNNLSVPYNLTYTVRNDGGYGTGKFYIEIVDSTASGNVRLLIDSVADLRRLHSQGFSHSLSLSTSSCHYLLVRADTNVTNFGIVDEWVESNNRAQVLVCHNPYIHVDLTTFNGYLNVQPVEPTNVGDTMYLASSIFNLGNMNVENGDTIHLKYEIELEHVADTFLYDQIASGLASGQSKNSIVLFQVPPHGNNLLRIRVDNPDSISESNELNNVAQFPLCWDFDIDHYQFNPAKSHYYVGESIDLIYRYFNKGLYSATNVNVKIFVDDTLIKSQNLPYVSPTGRQFYGYNDNYPLTNSYRHSFLSAGYHTIRYVIDADSSFIECNELNNTDSVRILIENQAPDLRILSQYISPTELNPDAGESVDLYLTYENIGMVTTDSFVVKCTVNDTAVGSEIRVNGLEPGEDTTILVDASWFDSNPGTSIIRGYVDYDNEITESDELNNVASRAIIVGDNATNLRILDIYYNIDGCDPAKVPRDVYVVVVNDGDAFNNADVGLGFRVHALGGAILGRQDNVNFPSGDTVTLFFSQALPPNYVISGNINAIYAEIVNVDVAEYNEFDNLYAELVCGNKFHVNYQAKNTCVDQYDGEIIINSPDGQTAENNPFQFFVRKLDEDHAFHIESGLATSDTVTNLDTGRYEITTVNSGLSVTDTIEIFFNDTVDMQGALDTNGCAGGIQLTVTGGQPFDTTFIGGDTIFNYQYVWEPALSAYFDPISYNRNLERAAPGGYQVTVTDSNGCRKKEYYTVTFDVGAIADSSTNSPCTFKDAEDWTYLLEDGKNRCSGIYDVDEDSTSGDILIIPTSTDKKANGVSYIGRILKMSTTDTANRDTFRVRLYYTFEEVDSLIARNDSVNDVNDIRIHKYNGPNQNTSLYDNYADTQYWQQFVPQVDTVDGVICFEIRITDFSEFYASGPSDAPLADGVKLRLKAFLGGCYNSGSGAMTDALRSNSLLPTTDPYTADAKFTVVGDYNSLESTSILADKGNNTNITDWVFVELIDPTDTTTVLAARAALIRKDGMITDVDGMSPVAFAGIEPGNYLVRLSHRNHLSVLSSTTMALNATVTDTADFADPSGITTYGTGALKTVSGVRVLWAGDANNNGNIKYNNASNDKNAVLLRVGLGNPNGTVHGYYKEDLNLDGDVKYNNASNDKNVILLNIGLGNPNNVINQQIK